MKQKYYILNIVEPAYRDRRIQIKKLETGPSLHKHCLNNLLIIIESSAVYTCQHTEENKTIILSFFTLF